MTASSKLKAKSVDRTSLYYGKFEYRLVVKSPHMFYSWNCKTIDDYKARITEIQADYENTKLLYWRPRPDPSLEEYELIENLYNLKTKYQFKHDFTFRREGDNCNVYTSNIKIVKDVLSFYPNAELSKVELAPAGTKYFKKDPPAKYRAYMTNNKMPAEFKQDMKDYLTRTPDVQASNAFYTYLNRANHYYQTWLWDTYFIDYNDERNLMMMHLMFPGAIGKTYKLEKK